MRAALLALLLAGVAPAAEASTVERGEELARRHCSGCHAVGREGAGPNPAAPPLRELHRRYEPEFLAEALAEGLLTGHPQMPEFRFSPEDVRGFIRYLNAIQTRQTGRTGSGVGSGR